MALLISLGAFSIPSLMGRPMVPQIMQAGATQVSPVQLTPEAVSQQATAAGEVFSVRVSGNIYYDKMPVSGAEVSVYLNGRKVGQTTAGDIYIFEVPGVRKGDTIRVDATYEGRTGSASEVVTFKSMSLNVNIKSGKSFIRNALEMLPGKDDLDKQQAAATPAPTSTPQQTSQSSGTPASTPSTSTTDANALTSQVVDQTTNTLANTIGRTKGAVAQPSTISTANDGSGFSFNSLADMMNAADTLAPTLS